MTVLWLSKIFGPLLIVFGAWYFLFAAEVRKNHAKTQHCNCYLLGFFYLFLGLFILSLHNTWMIQRELLLTLLGWVLILRALAVLFIPHVVEKTLVKREAASRIIGIILFFWGLGIFSITF